MKNVLITSLALTVFVTPSLKAGYDRDGNWQADHFEDGFTVVQDCIDYQGKFWAGRIAKCKKLAPEVVLPPEGKTHAEAGTGRK